MQPDSPSRISTAFIWRRVHSLMGFWLVLYLILHLVTNSQAAVWLGAEGQGFVRMVNSLEELPYLHEIEVMLIAIPLGVHLIWGIGRLFQAKVNALPSNQKPSLKYERNVAYTLQRWSSWILLFGILGHVVQMRFLHMPEELEGGYSVTITMDKGLRPLSDRLGVALHEKDEKIIAVADSPGKAMLLMVRDTFKSPIMAGLYTLFVLAAAFHAFNGFWTFLITWGVILSYRSQKAMIPVSVIGIVVLAFLGLAAIWGSYWIS